MLTRILNDRLEASREGKEGRAEEEKGYPTSINRGECEEPGCRFVGQTKAGLVNHTRQRHGSTAQFQHKCTFCGQSFHKEGIAMHTRHCSMNPNRH